MSKLKNKNIASEISDIISKKAKFDSSDDENENTKAKVVEVFDDGDSDRGDLRESKLRKQNIQFLDKTDKRYAGKKVSRKDYYKEEFEDASQTTDDSLSQSLTDDEEVDNEEVDDDEVDDDEVDDDEVDDEEVDDEEVDDDDKELNNEQEFDYNSDENGLEEALSEDQLEGTQILNVPESNIKEQIQKGKCVQNQIQIWENLLDTRIKFQKILQASNKMPQYDVFKNYKSDNNFTTKSKELQHNLGCLLDKLLKLDNILLNKTKLNAKDSKHSEDQSDEEILSDFENESENDFENDECQEDEETINETPMKKRKLSLSGYDKIILKKYQAYIPCRNAEIKKWNDKTRIATAGTHKGSNQPILQQIEFILKDKPKLIKRTQLKRSEYKIIGKVTEEVQNNGRVEEYDSEIYDDDDFYHELLREFIHHKTSNITDPMQLSKHWVQLQNMRSKLKRKVDTRATKGRKLRYNVHQKLLNYMAPITINDTMSDHAKTELYNSLFGKIKLK